MISLGCNLDPYSIFVPAITRLRPLSVYEREKRTCFVYDSLPTGLVRSLRIDSLGEFQLARTSLVDSGLTLYFHSKNQGIGKTAISLAERPSEGTIVLHDAKVKSNLGIIAPVVSVFADETFSFRKRPSASIVSRARFRT